MDDMETHSKTVVIKITENSEKAPKDTEAMSTASNSIGNLKEITSGSMITIASTDGKNNLDEQKDQNNQGEQKGQDDQGYQGNQGAHGEITSELHLESILSSMQSCIESGSTMIIASTDEKNIHDEEKDQDDQGDQGGPLFDGDHWVHGDQEPELKKTKAKPLEYICVILVSLLCIGLPFTWYHLHREHPKDVILPYNRGRDVQSNDSCPFWHLVGDNYCDAEANIAECGYDLEDCCKIKSDRSACTDCLCYVPEDKKVVIKEQFTKNCLGSGEYAVEWFQYFGDGLCDLGFNSKEHFFDIGDCCLENPFCMSSTFLSTAHDPYCEEDCIKSNIFCIKEELGDRICQGHNNGPFCDHDLGDCCLVNQTINQYAFHETSKTNCTCNCECFLDAYYQIPWFLG